MSEEYLGKDGYKRIKGLKRLTLCNTQSDTIAVDHFKGNIHDSTIGISFIKDCIKKGLYMKEIYIDKGFNSKELDKLCEDNGIKLMFTEKKERISKKNPRKN
jgi:hypothetical protein